MQNAMVRVVDPLDALTRERFPFGTKMKSKTSQRSQLQTSSWTSFLLPQDCDNQPLIDLIVFGRVLDPEREYQARFRWNRFVVGVRQRIATGETSGVDIDAEWLDFARSRDSCARYVQADALALPFADNRFDVVLSIAAPCFTRDWQRAVAEIVRVSGGRFTIGMLNQRSLLWHEKGRSGGSGAYRGA